MRPKKKFGLLIIGAGQGGKALLEILLPKASPRPRQIEIIGVADPREKAPGMILAKELDIPVASDYRKFLKNKNLSIIIDVTGNPQISREISRNKPPKVELIGGASAMMFWGLIERVSKSEEQIKNYVDSLLTLLRLGQAVSSTLDLEKVLHSVVKQAVKILQVNVCSLRLLDDTRENLVLVASIGHSSQYLQTKKILRLKESIAGLAILEKKAITIDDVQKDPRYTHPELAREEKIRSLLSVPLLEKGSGVIGVLNVYTRNKHVFTEEERELLFLFAGQSTLAIINARLYEKIEDYTHNLEKKVKEQTEKLLHQEKLAAIGQLSSGIAHELRNPLAVIKSAAYYLRNISRHEEIRSEYSAKLFKHFDLIDREVIISVKIINDLLEFARVPKISCDSVDVNQVLERTLELIEKPNRITLRKDLLPELPYIEADADRLRQVFGNLIANAYDAISETVLAGREGGELSIATRVSSGDSTIEIILRDNGCGINRENLAKIFDPLFTTKSKGTGLGLAVCKGIITAHQGEIRVESEISKGTTFIIKLPIKRSREDAEE